MIKKVIIFSLSLLVNIITVQNLANSNDFNKVKIYKSV